MTSPVQVLCTILSEVKSLVNEFSCLYLGVGTKLQERALAVVSRYQAGFCCTIPDCQSQWARSEVTVCGFLEPFGQTVTLGSPGDGQGPLGLADIRSAARLPQPPGSPGVTLSETGAV